MLAALTYDLGEMKIEEINKPEIKDGHVLVRVEVCQPSVTDVMRFRGVGSSGVQAVKNLLKEHSPYQLFGHEFSGIVMKVGKGVKRFKEGQRVSSRASISCGECVHCMHGEEDYCLHTSRIGVNSEGCFAEYVALPEGSLEVVPTGVSANEAACLQPLSSARGCVDKADIKMGDTVAILGLGVMGLYCAQMAKLSGASTVIGFDVKEDSLELASSLGVDIVVNSKSKNPKEFIDNYTEMVGVDVVFECAGGNPKEGLAGHKTIGQAFEIIRQGGKIVQVSHPLPGKTMPFELTALTTKMVTYIGLPVTTRAHFNDAAKLLADKKIDIKSLISHELKGIDKVPEAFEITGNKAKYNATGPAQVVIWQKES